MLAKIIIYQGPGVTMSPKEGLSAPAASTHTVYIAATPSGYECNVVWPTTLGDTEIASRNPAPDASPPTVPAGTYREVVVVR